MIRQKVGISVLVLFLFGCIEEPPSQKSINDNLIISEELYDETKTDNYTIEKASIVGDSLHVTITSSGCDGNSWIVKLIDSGAIAESYPVQRFVKIALGNEELCDAVFSKEYVINISFLQVESQLYLNLQGWADQLLYNF